MMLIDYRWTDVRKCRYDGKCARANARVVRAKAVGGTTDEEKYSERLILESIKQLILFENQNVGLDW